MSQTKAGSRSTVRTYKNLFLDANLSLIELGLQQSLHTNVDLSNFAGANYFDVLYVSVNYC